MNIRGVAFLSRKALLEKEHGEAAWAKVMARLVERAPFFKTPVFQVSSIPIEAFLIFHEVVVEVLYGNKLQAYWDLGEKGGHWSATHGPAKSYASVGVQLYLRGMPGIWKAHYDAGEMTTELIPGGVKVTVKGVPEHPFFEGGALGFVRGGMKAAGAKNLRTRCIKGFSKKDPYVEYEFLYD